MREYLPNLSASVNSKGVLDIDTVKGCTHGMADRPGGCYGLCYAAKIAKARGFDFSKSISRHLPKSGQRVFDFMGTIGDPKIWKLVESHHLEWFRIGTMGDPSHDWELTAQVCEWLCSLKVPVIVTKHWKVAGDEILRRLYVAGVVFNTSISALDTDAQIKFRLAQFKRIEQAGMKSVLRIVSCRFGVTEWGAQREKVQSFLFSHRPHIDNPLRIPASDPRVVSGDIIAKKVKDLDSAVSMSIQNDDVYVGHCNDCPDQCGVNL